MARRCLLFNVVIAACLMSGACVSDMHVNTHNMGVDAVESPAIGSRRVNIHCYSLRNTALDRGGLADIRLRVVERGTPLTLGYCTQLCDPPIVCNQHGRSAGRDARAAPPHRRAPAR